MKKLLTVALLCCSATAQTHVYLRSGPPAAVQVTGVDYSTGTVTTATGHGLNSNCGVGGGHIRCLMEIEGTPTTVATSGGVCPVYFTTAGTAIRMSKLNGTVQAAYVDATHYQAYDLSDTLITDTGTWCTGESINAIASWQWTGALTDYTLGTQPLGWFDGLTGPNFRRFALGTSNGLSSLTVTGGSGGSCASVACQIVVTTTGYDPTASTDLPAIAAGQDFTVWGTGTVLDSTNAASCGGGSALNALPYAMASVSTTGWTSSAFTCSGLTTGNYTSLQTNCGGGGDDTQFSGSASCAKVSRTAYMGNPTWNGLMTVSSRTNLDDSSATNYKSVIDGGLQYSGSPLSGEFDAFGAAALRFMVDQTNTLLFRDLQYAYRNFEIGDGGAWAVNETQNEGGTRDEAQGQNYDGYFSLGIVEAAYDSYAAAATSTTFLNKVYNDVYNPSNLCTKQGVEATTSTGVNYVVRGLQTTVAATSTAVTLDSGASATTNAYQNLVIMFGSSAPTSGTWGLITAYNGSTKVASVSSWHGTAPATGGGDTYNIFATGIWSSISSGASGTATITMAGGKPSDFGVSIGDVVFGDNGWPTVLGQTGPTLITAKVTAVNNSTPPYTMTVYNNGGLSGSNASTSTYSLLWHFVNPSSNVSSTSLTGSVGICGLMWARNHSELTYGMPPSVYPNNAGSNTTFSGSQVNFGSNQQMSISMGHMGLGFFNAPKDQRAVNDLTLWEGVPFDYVIPPYMAYLGSGSGANGTNYSVWVSAQSTRWPWMVGHSVPTFPTMFPTGAWNQYFPIKAYGLLPDFKNANSGSGQPMCYGQYCSNAYIGPNNGSGQAGDSAWDESLSLAPTATLAPYNKYWISHVMGTVGDMFNFFGSATTYYNPMFLGIDPNVASSDFRGLPTQFGFTQTNQANVAAFSGWNVYPANANGLGFLSRTGWGLYGDSAHYNDTVVFFRDAGFIGQHDNPEPGLTRAYKRGPLLDSDPPTYAGASGGVDQSILGTSVQFGGPQANWYNEFHIADSFSDLGTTNLLRWADQNAGSMGSQFGDNSSRYVHMCVDAAGMYVSSWGVNYAVRCANHFKRTGYDEFIVESDEVSTSVSEPVSRSIHYSQNGQNVNVAYPTGRTYCVNSGGAQVDCAGLNSNRRIESVEQSGQGFGLLTQIYSPSTVTLNWDCPGSYTTGNQPQCAPGSTYSGGYGYTDRITIAGGGSVGASVTALEDVVVHKVMNGLSDTALLTAALNPSSGWTGAEACGVNSGIAYLGIRSGGTGTVPSFSTSVCSSLPYQYLITGVAAGTYAVTVNSTPVTGSPFTVLAGNNTLYFEAGSGTVVVGAGGPPQGGTKVAGKAGGSGGVIIH